MAVNAILIGARFQKARKSKGLRQKDVAEPLGLTEQYISRLERGDGGMNLTTLSDIADFLGVDIAMLISNTNLGSPSYGMDEIYAIMNAATPLQREDIIAHAKIVVKK